MDNLRLAYVRARKGKEHKGDVVIFSKLVEKRLMSLRNALLEENYQPGAYHFFRIYEPKERIICAAPFHDRVIHHAIMNICHPVFERFQINDSYATRIGKGQFAALKKAYQWQQNHDWFCKMDIRKYFDSIPHVRLKELLERIFKDPRLLALFNRIIDSYEVMPGFGIPIGNLTSQYFANFYLAYLDHFVKDRLRIKAFVRYMDDMVIWGSDKSVVLEQYRQSECFISERLRLELKPPCIHNSIKGLPFLGFVLFPTMIRLNKQSRKRFIQKMGKYYSFLIHGNWDQQTFANHVLPLIAFTQHAQTKTLRSNVIRNPETGLGAPTA